MVLDRVDHAEIKRYNELRVARPFAAYLRSQGLKLGDVATGDITLGHPDAVCESPGGLIGIEIAEGSYDGQEHRDSWALLRNQPERSSRHLRPGEDLRAAARRSRVLTDFTGHLIDNLQRTLDSHCTKRYSVSTYLVLDATMAPMTIDERGQEIIAGLRLPSSHPFLGVFLAVVRNYSNEPVHFQLWPSES